MRDLLIEILVEEIPADFAVPAIESMKKIFAELFDSNNIKYSNIVSYTTPRRLALLIDNLEEKAADSVIEVKGPLYDVAFKDNKATQVGIGFLNSNNIDASLINSMSEKEEMNKPFIKDISGKKYICIKKEKKGLDTVTLLQNNLESLFSKIHFPKKMRWADKDFPFVRPIRGITLIYGSDVVKTTVAGIETSNTIKGHRLLSPNEEIIKNPKDYESIMEKKSVIVCREKRLKSILTQLIEIEKKNNSIAVDKEKVAEIVVDLVEYPFLLTAEFDKRFLEVPDEVLITQMVVNQKYFPLKDKTGKLTNLFVITSNQPETKQIIAGNIRVLTARLSDGRFLYKEDLKTTLDKMNDKLDSLLFRATLGTMKDKVERMLKNADNVVTALNIEEKKEDVQTAIKYMKGDLVSNMVYEFPELQGIMGGYYAKDIKLKDDITLAIREQYKPLFALDSLPSNDIAKTIAIIDKLDNIVSSYYLDDIPTGSKDPNALRRQALGIINILIDWKKNVDIKKLIELFIKNMPTNALKNKSTNMSEDILEFFKSRLSNDLSDKFSEDAIRGVLATSVSDIYESYLKIASIDNFRKNNEELFNKLLTVFKRINNIIKINTENKINESLLTEPTEKELYKIYKEKLVEVNENIKNKNYEKSFEILSSFEIALENFFKDVMVLVDDEKIKNNRVSLLSAIDNLFKTMLDFSILVK